MKLQLKSTRAANPFRLKGRHYVFLLPFTLAFGVKVHRNVQTGSAHTWITKDKT